MSDPVDPRGPVLLHLAREAIERRLLERGTAPRTADGATTALGWLRDRGASFVSLHKHGGLRGCVGSLQPLRPLIEDVQRNALAAALDDTRFAPVAAGELADLRIEVTLLAPMVALPCRSEHEALAQLRPGLDGLVLHYESRRATFLPQVWRSLPQPVDFLAALKEKAGLGRDFWHPSIVLERYSTVSWSEEDELLTLPVM